MAKTLIGNIKGKDGRGISKIEKTATTGSVDTYTITYTDGTSTTYEVKNSDEVAIQRQIVPSAAVESSATASQAYTSGDYVVVGGVLRKVTSSITKGSTIGDSNSTATTVTGELGALNALSPKVIATGTAKLLGANYNVTAVAYGKVVCIEAQSTGGRISSSSSTSSLSDTVITIPEGFRSPVPTSASFLVVDVVCDMYDGKALGFVIYADGTVKLHCSSSGTLNNSGADSFGFTYVAH